MTEFRYGNCSTVDVIETIAVKAEGNEIRHGIYRDIPITLINADRSRVRSDLTVLSVLQDGEPANYTIDNIGDGFRRIGKQNRNP